MNGGTLFVSRAVRIHPWIKRRLEELGFTDVTVTAKKKDALNREIGKLKPRLLMIGSGFYQAGTPLMAGELHRNFPKLNIAAVSVHDFPLSRAPWFIWYGAKSYVSFWEGDEEFYRGLRAVREGKRYVSPAVQKILDGIGVTPGTKNKMTGRQKECLTHLCCGLTVESIGDEMHVSKRTVYSLLNSMYNVFHVNSREEMVALAWVMELVTKDDIRFYDRRREDVKLPEWAVVTNNINKIINSDEEE